MAKNTDKPASRTRTTAHNSRTNAPLARYIGGLLLVALERGVVPPEDVGDWLRHEVSSRLEGIPEQDIVHPDPRIAMPLIVALGCSMTDDVIRTLFANLLSANMTGHRRPDTHPAFVQMIAQMVSLDAIVLGEFRQGVGSDDYPPRTGEAAMLLHMNAASFCELAELGVAELMMSANNLVRLGLVAAQPSLPPAVDDRETVARHDTIRSQIATIKRQHRPTPLGQRFIGSCLS